MFEKTLQESIQTIFGLSKARFDLPGESEEQECLFIQVDTSRNTIKDGRAYFRVTGRIRIFANQDKMPFGYLSKRIAKANKELTKPFFFFDFEENSGTFMNIAERTVSFVYFFNGQYDPDLGTITSIELSEAN